MNIDRFSKQLSKHWSSISRYADLPIDDVNRPNVNPSSARVQPPRPSDRSAKARAMQSQQSRLKFEPETAIKDRMGRPLRGQFAGDFSLGQAQKESVMPHNWPDSELPRRKLRKGVQADLPSLPSERPSQNIPTIPMQKPMSQAGFAKGVRDARRRSSAEEQAARTTKEKLPAEQQIKPTKSDLLPPVRKFPRTPDIAVPGEQEVAEERPRGRQRAIDLRQGRRGAIDDMSPPPRKQTKTVDARTKRRLKTDEELKRKTAPNLPKGGFQQRAAKLATEKDLLPPESDFYQEPPESPDIYVDRDPQAEQEEAPSERLPFPDPSQIGKAPDTRSGEAGNAEARRPRKADISPDGMQNQFGDAEETRGQPADPVEQADQAQPQQAQAEPQQPPQAAAPDTRKITDRMLDDTFDADEVRPELSDKEFKEAFGKTRASMEREAHSMRRKRRVLQFNKENRVARDRDRAANRRWRMAIARSRGGLTGSIAQTLGNFFINRSEQQNHLRRSQFNDYMQAIDTAFVEKQSEKAQRQLEARAKPPIEPGSTVTQTQFDEWYKTLPDEQQALGKDFLKTSFNVVEDGNELAEPDQQKSVIDDLEERLDSREPGQATPPFEQPPMQARPMHPHEGDPTLYDKAKDTLGEGFDDELSKHDTHEILSYEQFQPLESRLNAQADQFYKMPFNPSSAEQVARQARRLRLAGYETDVPFTVENLRRRHEVKQAKASAEKLFSMIARLESVPQDQRDSREYRNFQRGIDISQRQLRDAGFGSMLDNARAKLEQIKEQQLNNKINELFSIYKQYQQAVSIERNAPTSHQKNLNDLHARFASLVQSLQDETGEDIGALTSHLVKHHPEIDMQDFRDLVDENSKPHQYVDLSNANLDKDEQQELVSQMVELAADPEDEEDNSQTLVSGEGQQLLQDFTVDVSGQARPQQLQSPIEQAITPAVNVTTVDEDEESDPFIETEPTVVESDVEPVGQLADATPLAPTATQTPVEPVSPVEEVEEEESDVAIDSDIEIEEDDLRDPLARSLMDWINNNELSSAKFWPMAEQLSNIINEQGDQHLRDMDLGEYFDLLDNLYSDLTRPYSEKAMDEQTQEKKAAHDAAVARLVADGGEEFYRLHTDNASRSDVMRYNPEDVVVDPSRFQYKRETDARGVTGEYGSTEAWNPIGGGVLLGWKDPEDGKMYVVNGHHRMEMAKRLNAPYVDIRPIEAENAAEARSIGALMNIMENQGTPLDTAAYMRDTNSTLDELKKIGLASKKSEIKMAYNLSKLLDGLWNLVTNRDPDGKTLKETQGSLIGEILPEPDQQEAFWNAHGKSVNEKTPLAFLERRLRMAKSQMQQAKEKSQGGLFSESQLQVKSPSFYELLTGVEKLAAAAAKTGKSLQSKRTKQFAGDKNILDDDQNAQQELANSRILRLGEMMGIRHEDAIFKNYNSQLQDAAEQIDNAPSKQQSKLMKKFVQQIYQNTLKTMESAPKSDFYSAYGNEIARISRQCIRRQFNIEKYMTRPFTMQDHLQNRIAAFWEVELN